MVWQNATIIYNLTKIISEIRQKDCGRKKKRAGIIIRPVIQGKNQYFFACSSPVSTRRAAWARASSSSSPG